MATQTTNLGLIKPAGTDKIRIAQINGNMDILDEKVGAVGNTSLQAQVTAANTAITNSENYKAGDSITFYRYCLLAQSSSNGSANGYVMMPKKMGSSLTISDSSVSVLMQDTSGNSITATATFARYSDEFLRVTLSATSGISSSAFYFVRFNATLTFS